MRDLLQEPLDWLKIHGWVAMETTPPSWSQGPITLICSEQGTWGDFTHRTHKPRHGWHNSPWEAFHVSYRKLLEEKAYYERAREEMAAALNAAVQAERR